MALWLVRSSLDLDVLKNKMFTIKINAGGNPAMD